MGTHWLNISVWEFTGDVFKKGGNDL
jgi:hypothetical protein